MAALFGLGVMLLNTKSNNLSDLQTSQRTAKTLNVYFTTIHLIVL